MKPPPSTYVPDPVADELPELEVQRPAVTHTGRRPGHSGTREAIHTAAAKQFAAQGYDRTSLRSIAREAGVDPGLVTHFFGSKEKLFLAVVEFPFETKRVVADVLAGDRAEIGVRLARFVVSVLGSAEKAARLVGLVRAAASEEQAARLVRESITRDLLVPMAQGLGMDEPELRGALVASQTVGMLTARNIVKLPALTALSAERLTAVIAPVYQHYLTEPLS